MREKYFFFKKRPKLYLQFLMTRNAVKSVKWDIFGNFQTLWMDTFRWPPKSHFSLSSAFAKIVIARAVWGQKMIACSSSKGLLHQVLQNCKSTRTTMQIRMWRWWWTMHCILLLYAIAKLISVLTFEFSRQKRPK